MTPSYSRRFTRRWQGVAERPTRSARSTIGSRPSACKAATMRLSMSSNSVMENNTPFIRNNREYHQNGSDGNATSPRFTRGLGRYIQAMDTLIPLANLRGDYSGMASDWTVPQQLDLYSAEDQAV